MISSSMNMISRRRPGAMLVAFGLLALAPSVARAQTAEPPRVSVNGFVDVGRLSFSAKDTFDAIFGESTATNVGFGVEVRFWRDHLFARVGGERSKKEGQRVFVFNNQLFPLGIKDEVTITPILVTGGCRLTHWPRVIPYGGGGFGSYKFQENSEFADPGEDVNERFSGYHVLGGAEFPLWRWVKAAAEVRWETVPNALGDSGVAKAFDENNLGGTSFRVRLLVGR